MKRNSLFFSAEDIQLTVALGSSGGAQGGDSGAIEGHRGPATTTTTYLNPVVDYQKASVRTTDLAHFNAPRVLVLYTGGTIGMKATEGGYQPVSNYLHSSLRHMHRFHDPFSADSVTVTVSRAHPSLHTTTLECLTTPRSIYGKHVQYTILEYTPLLDSANMEMSDWVKIASDIEANYSHFDAFVVLHGTDTMAYTASALSFMLEDLGKTVILTGSQVPLAEWRTDAEENLLGALLLAGHFVIPEVCLYFDNKLFRGNRSTKMAAMDFGAFESPNLKPLATMSVNIDVNWSEIRRPKKMARFRVHKNLCANVAALRLFPGITASTVRAFLSEPIQGVVLETYGAGNGPDSRKDLLDLFKEASQRGVVIVNCTQCKRGLVSDAYATGRALADAGVVPGSDMTPECALTKLCYLLGKSTTANTSNFDVRALIRKNLRGELTIPFITLPNPTEEPSFPRIHQSLIPRVLSALSEVFDEPIDRKRLENALVPHLVCAAAASNDLSPSDDIDPLSNSRSSSSSGASTSVQATYNNPWINVSDMEGKTPLHIAAGYENLPVVTYLLKHGASVHARDRYDRTPLFYACWSQSAGNVNYAAKKDVIAMLTATGATFSDEEIAEVTYWLLRSITNGRVEDLELYVLAGININDIRTETKQTLLHIAVIKNQRIIEKYLREKGIDENAVDLFGKKVCEYNKIME